MVASTHDTICMQLASVASTISHSPLPTKIVEEVRLCLLDFLTSTLAAPMTPMIAETATLFGDGPARLLHTEVPISVAGATFVHGFLSTVEDIDDAHALASGMHLSATTFPVILALAQSIEFSGATFLRATIAGYEIAGRLCRSMDEGLRARGFHASGAIGPFASCAAAAIILRLNWEQIVHAFGIAASGAGGTFAFQTTGADSRHMHAANAGVVGLTAAMAAKNGATGSITAFEGPDGFIGTHSETCDREFIDSPAPVDDVDYEILNAYHKLFSACGHALPAITLALDLRQNRLIPIDQIARVKIYGYRASARLVTFPTSTVSEAKFSLPVIFALAYLYGDVSPKEMKTEVIQRPEVQTLASKVEVYERSSHTSDLPRIRGGSVEIVRQDGQTEYLSTQAPIGMRRNRLTIGNVLHKFDAFTTLTLERSRAEIIVSRVMALNDTKTGYDVF
ncbi:MAG: MmgE/PrpD family protein [Aestuariivita sp.]|nr:MmgE/PrpD family protein [Aestuariivita sp.]